MSVHYLPKSVCPWMHWFVKISRVAFLANMYTCDMKEYLVDDVHIYTCMYLYKEMLHILPLAHKIFLIGLLSSFIKQLV